MSHGAAKGTRMARRPEWRRSQEERSSTTRTRLLEAAVESLAEVGASATTTPDVAKRAGLSRGAQQHHFNTKADLMLEVARHVTERFHADLRAAVDDLPTGPDRIGAAIDVMWTAYNGPRAMAHTELWVAARADPGLNQALYEVERSLVPETRVLLRRLFAEDDAHGEQVDIFVDLTAQFMRGLILRGMLRGAERWIERDLAAWKRVAEATVPAIERGELRLGTGRR
jgi:AcrR family transcriptional regulator